MERQMGFWNGWMMCNKHFLKGCWCTCQITCLCHKIFGEHLCFKGIILYSRYDDEQALKNSKKVESTHIVPMWPNRELVGFP